MNKELEKRMVAYLQSKECVLKEWTGICPVCENPIEYSDLTLPMLNDIENVVVCCYKCNNHILIPVNNAEYFDIIDGAKKVWQNSDESSIVNSLQKIKDIKCLRVPSFDIFATGVSEARQTLKLPFIGLPE